MALDELEDWRKSHYTKDITQELIDKEENPIILKI
jgi:hypothetical protein